MLHPGKRSRFVTLSLPLLAAAIGACGGGGGGGSGGGAGQFRLLSVNVPEASVWPLNQRMVFDFNKPLDLGTVSFNSIVIQGSNGVPVTGTFFVDPCAPGTRLVFQPTCPTDSALVTGGLQPNAITYTLTLLTGVGPTVLRATDGDPLMEGASVIFRTPIPPFEPPLADPDPTSPPFPTVTAPDPGVPLPLNLFSDPIESFDVSFDQSLDPAPSNVSLENFVLEFSDPANPGTFVEIPRTVTLVQNCTLDLASPDCPRPEKALVKIVPLGILPAGETVRVRVAEGVRDIGQVQALPADVVAASYTVEPPDPGGNEDAFTEEFLTSEHEDVGVAFDVPTADWGGGVLTANEPFPGVESTFDWTVQAGTTVFLDTSFDVVVNNVGQQAPVVNGVLNLHNLVVGANARVLGQGPNPLVINATGRITVIGEINVDGIDALNTGGLNTPEQPQSGAPGNCGGGQGGAASLSAVGSDVQGEDGYGPGNTPSGGGKGGHSCFGTGPDTQRRGGGGGGGILTRKTHSLPFAIGAPPWPVPAGLNGSNGGPGPGVGDCVDLALPVDGGAFGPDVFTDTDAGGVLFTGNDFFGRKFVLGGNPLAGELNALVAGQGGGGGGDAVFYSATTPNPNCLNNTQWQGNAPSADRKGGAAGGGGGVLILRAIGPIVVTSTGKLSAKGGNGGHGESILFINPAGGGGGGGSGGMIMVESADASAQDPLAAPGTPGGIRIEATNTRFEVRGGDGGLGVDQANTPTTVCRGGMGGGGTLQLHSARFDAVGNPIVRLGTPPGTDVTSFSTPTIDQHNNAWVLLPNFGPKSRARSAWIDAGAVSMGSLGTVLYPWVSSPPNNTTNLDYPLVSSVPQFPGLAGVVKTDPAGKVFLPPFLPGTDQTIPLANVTQFSATIPVELASNPATLVRYAFNPNTAQTSPPQLFTIVSATYDGTNTVIQTDPGDGSMMAVLPAAGSTTVRVHPRYFRVFTQGTADTILPGQAVAIQFQGATDPLSSATYTTLSPNLDGIAGKRYFRFVVDFDLGASGISLSTPRPEIRFLKLPIQF